MVKHIAQTLEDLTFDTLVTEQTHKNLFSNTAAIGRTLPVLASHHLMLGDKGINIGHVCKNLKIQNGCGDDVLIGRVIDAFLEQVPDVEEPLKVRASLGAFLQCYNELYAADSVLLAISAALAKQDCIVATSSDRSDIRSSHTTVDLNTGVLHYKNSMRLPVKDLHDPCGDELCWLVLGRTYIYDPAQKNQWRVRVDVCKVQKHHWFWRMLSAIGRFFKTFYQRIRGSRAVSTDISSGCVNTTPAKQLQDNDSETVPRRSGAGSAANVSPALRQTKQ